MNNSFCEEIFYSFNIDEDSNDEYIEPSIVRLCMNDPIIVIKNHKKEAIKRNDIDVIIKEEKNISIEVELKDGEMVIGEDSFGYKIINASRVMYERSEVFNEIEAIEVSEDNTFEMQNFGFVMLSYNCEYCWNSTKVIKKLIFFRPKETVYDEGLIFYNNSNFVPFCLLNDERFGYLVKLTKNNIEVDILSPNGQYQINGDKAFLLGTDGSGVVKCTYMTPYPDNSTINSFWKMVHDENIDIIISLTFDDYEPDEIKRYIYWKLSMEAHGDLTVDYVKTSYLEMMNTSALTFNLITGDDNIKSLTIFHIKGWKINSVPKSSHDLKKLYENIIETDSTNNVLIHTTYGGNTKIYIFAYFLAMVDSLIYDRSDKDPMEVIKLIRSKRYGGIIGPLEFAYLIHSIVEYFIDKKIIKDRKGFSKFHREYEKFFDEITYIPKAIDNNLKNFIYFMKMYDKVMMEEICKQELLKTVLKNDVIMKKCRRFIHAENFCASKKSSYNLNRYQYAYCFDEYAVNGGNFIIPGDTIPGYINANEITYRLIDGSERKIIMCQLPTKGTLHGVFDMFFEQDVSSVAVLLNPEEMESFIPYLKCNKEEQDYGTFQIILLEKRQFADKNSLSYRFKIIKGSKAEIDINIFIYTEWNDKDLPNNMVSFYKFYIGLVHNIYKKPLVIQCRAGIGRTGLLALLIYSIDNISSSRPFDLIRNLHFISSHRYRAIENTKQLFFTLDVILYHFKNELKNTNEYSFESISSKFKSTTTSLPSNRIKGKYKLRKSVR
uniref:TYR_PHOSPHATASE_2 domain-containing protein n=1 Tax=Parastrongyloides trichosuri TaxID=131310 RepID=A0A0N4ZIJ1_PARTI